MIMYLLTMLSGKKRNKMFGIKMLCIHKEVKQLVTVKNKDGTYSYTYRYTCEKCNNVRFHNTVLTCIKGGKDV